MVVLCNLKARNMRGVKSYGMLMAASDKAHENVELVRVTVIHHARCSPRQRVPGGCMWEPHANHARALSAAARAGGRGHRGTHQVRHRAADPGGH